MNSSFLAAGVCFLSTCAAAPGSVSNGDFESGEEPWFFYTNGRAEAGVSSPGYLSDGAFKVLIDATGSNTQLLQRNLDLLPDTEYLFAFMGYSNTGHNIRVSLSNDGPAYIDYGLNRVWARFDLTSQWQAHFMLFDTKGFASPVSDGKLFFWLASDARYLDEYYLDNVILTPVIRGGAGRPSAPAAQALAISEEEVKVCWEASEGEGVLGYFVYRDGRCIGNSSLTSFFDDGLVQCTEYGYTVMAIDDRGRVSDHSSEVLAKTLPAENLIAFGGFESALWRYDGNDPYDGHSGDAWAVGGIGPHGILAFSSDAYSGDRSLKRFARGLNRAIATYSGIDLKPDTRYELSFAAKSSLGGDIGVTLDRFAAAQINYGLRRVEVGLTPEWRVYTIDFTTSSSVARENDGVLRIATAPMPAPWQCYQLDDVKLREIADDEGVIPQAPIGLEAAPVSDTMICLSWSDPNEDLGGLGYFVVRNGMEIGMTMERSFVDRGLEPGQVCEYTVTAFSLAGNESASSAKASARTPLAFPEGINLLKNGGFEKSLAPWDTIGGRTYVVASDPFEGVYMGSAHFNHASPAGALRQFGITLEPDTEYILTFAAKIHRPTEGAVHVSISDVSHPMAPNYGLDKVRVDLTDEWQTRVLKFKSRGADGVVTNATLAFAMWETINAYHFDEIRLFKAADLVE